MKLVGFEFFENQDKFEAWQIENPENNVCSVQAHLRTAGVEKTADMSMVWGVFVTYQYDKPNA